MPYWISMLANIFFSNLQIIALLPWKFVVTDKYFVSLTWDLAFYIFYVLIGQWERNFGNIVKLSVFVYCSMCIVVYIVLNDCFTSSMCTICSSIQKHLEPYRLASWVIMFFIDTCLFTSASTQVATTLKTVSMYQRIFYPRKQSIGYIDVIYRNYTVPLSTWLVSATPSKQTHG